MKKVLISMAVVHLVLVLHGAFKMPFWEGRRPLDSAVYHYGELSGSIQCYSFFAPEVAPAFRARLVVCLPGGRVEAFPLKLNQHESNLRLDSLLFQFIIEAERSRRGIAACWAGSAFTRFPNAESIDIVVEVNALPTMTQYRQGLRPRWLPAYTGRFEKKQAF